MRFNCAHLLTIVNESNEQAVKVRREKTHRKIEQTKASDGTDKLQECLGDSPNKNYHVIL